MSGSGQEASGEAPVLDSKEVPDGDEEPEFFDSFENSSRTMRKSRAGFKGHLTRLINQVTVLLAQHRKLRMFPSEDPCAEKDIIGKLYDAWANIDRVQTNIHIIHEEYHSFLCVSNDSSESDILEANAWVEIVSAEYAKVVHVLSEFFVSIVDSNVSKSMSHVAAPESVPTACQGQLGDVASGSSDVNSRDLIA